ncbi:hypothetical protein BGX24_006280 [Mortierella sp. AD032]|nr:hypothetical protein BGX24_006280 [Mortierella sp. AD032]
MKITIAFAMMAALTITLIAGTVEAATRHECGNACAQEYHKCVKAAKPRCQDELFQCNNDCDG